MTDQTRTAFEALARDMLARHPAIRHEWRPVHSRWSGDRLDLVCNPSSSDEVWASIRDGAIAVGAGDDHEDFEGFGRNLSEAAVAHEAFTRLVTLLREHGHPEAAA